MSQIKKSILADQVQKLRRESEERVAERRAQKFNLPYLSLDTTPVQTEALGLVKEEIARDAGVAVISKKETKGGRELGIVVFDPDNHKTRNVLEYLKNQGFEISIFIGSMTGLERLWGFYQFVYETKKAITGRVSVDNKKNGKNKLEELEKQLINLGEIRKRMEQTSATADILEIALVGAIVNRASDIHIEPSEKNIVIRNRIDGVLYVVFDGLTRSLYESLISRIKLLSNLKLNIKDESQDGRFSLTLKDRDIEIRVSIIPAEFGEMVVMRLLDSRAIAVQLNDLGLRADDLEILKRNLAMPNGMVINTGPTGSGKTTTLYACLRSVANSENKVITIEDPIEYRLEWVEQTQVDEDAGYTFIKGLRAILRQDPDVILIGEVRDLETADIAVQAALTGHLVFSTLHTNDAAGAIPRFINLGVSTAVLGSALNLIIAQRLVRKLCDKCKEEKVASEDFLNKIKKFLEALPQRVNRENYKLSKIYEAKKENCSECDGLGYKGRIAIFELLEMNKEIQGLINKETSVVTFADAAKRSGMVTLKEDGILKILEGVTTLDEVQKAVGVIDI